MYKVVIFLCILLSVIPVSASNLQRTYTSRDWEYRLTDMLSREAGVVGTPGVSPLPASGLPSGVPEGGMLFLHPLEELFHRHVPVHLVSVGDEQGGQGFGRVAQPVDESGVAQRGGNLGGVYHQLFAHVPCQAVQGAHASDGEVHRFLVAAVQAAEHVVDVFPRADGIPAGVYAPGVVAVACHPPEARQVSGLSGLPYLIIYGVEVVVAVNVDVLRLLRVELRGKQQVVAGARTCQGDEHDGRRKGKQGVSCLFLHGDATGAW